MDPNAITHILLDGGTGRFDTERRRESSVMVEAETGVMCLQASGCCNTYKLEGAKTRFFPSEYGGS